MCNTSIWVPDVNTQCCTVSSTGVATRKHSNSVHAEHRLTCIVVVDVYICPTNVATFTQGSRIKMSALLLQLSLYAVIQLTSSQSTYDVTQRENDASSCGCSGQSEQVLYELVTMNSQLMNAVSQLQRGVADLKNAVSPTDVKGNVVS